MIIKNIIQDGIYYTNDTGKDFFLSFKECNENWLSFKKRTESLTEEQISGLRGKDKTIGQRDVNSNNCFIEFFTRPFTRFEFKYPQESDKYRMLRDKVMQYGWNTNDLS